jgi:hypothetical protein
MEPQSSGSLLNTEGEVTLCNSIEFFSNRKFVEYKGEVTLSNRKEGFFSNRKSVQYISVKADSPHIVSLYEDILINILKTALVV